MAKYTKNKKGLYRTGVLIGYDENGRQIRKWLSARTIAELEKKIMDVKNDIASGRNLLDEDVRFGDYARMWLETYKANRGINTREMYDHLLKKQFCSLDGMKVKDIRPLHLQALINEHSDTPRICEQMRMALRQIFKQAISDSIVLKNPAADLELPRHIKKEKRALTAEETHAVETANLTERERAFIMIAYGCGLRPGEIYALTWDDIDFKKSVIHVNKSIVFEKRNRPQVCYPKTNKSIRDVEAPRVVINALKAYRSINITPILFYGQDGGYRGRNGYIGEWERIKKKIEEKLGHETDLTLYCFRHNYLTLLFYSGVSSKEAQRIAGHTSYKMIAEIYAHLDAQKEDTLTKLNAIFDNTEKDSPCCTNVAPNEKTNSASG